MRERLNHQALPVYSSTSHSGISLNDQKTELSDMNEKENALRQEIIAACLQMNDLGINQGSAGNISARYQGGMLITPSGTPYHEMQVEDIVWMPLQKGQRRRGKKKPSSEWRFHYDILKARPEAGAVVHTHSTYATAMAICGLDIPAHHYMVAAAGGPDIRCAKYATFATQKLSDNAIAALEGRKACLLANHGVITIGENITKALRLAQEVETLARMYHVAHSLGGMTVLDDREMDRVMKRFQTYGQQKKQR